VRLFTGMVGSIVFVALGRNAHFIVNRLICLGHEVFDVFFGCRHIRKAKSLAGKATLKEKRLMDGSVLYQWTCKKCGKIVATQHPMR